jgi:hypothetical protein
MRLRSYSPSQNLNLRWGCRPRVVVLVALFFDATDLVAMGGEVDRFVEGHAMSAPLASANKRKRGRNGRHGRHS